MNRPPAKANRLDRTAAHRAADRIEQLIADGTLSPGEHVSEPSLAVLLGLSRGPIREACRALVERGLLQSEPNRGCFVRRLSMREVVDLYDVRAALARLAGRVLARRITPSQQVELARIVDTHEQAVAHGELEQVHSANLAFHAAIVAFSGNLRLQKIEAGMARELAMYRRHALRDIDHLRSTCVEHRAILDALAARDADAAGAALEAHILAGRVRFLESIGRDASLEPDPAT